MMRVRFRPFFIAGVLVAVASGAAACSSTPSASTSSPPSTNPQATTTTASSSSASSSTVKVSDNATYGKILANSAGMALYTYGPDQGHNGQATCSGSCLQAWPALTVAAGTTPTAGPGVTGIAAVKQASGEYQVTYNGMPLYTFVQDSSAGEVTGNGASSFSVAKVSSGSGGAGSAATTTTTKASSGVGGY